MKSFKLNYIFYISLVLSFIILLFPLEYKMGGYTPNILGWIWLILLIPVTLITFFYLLITDLRNKTNKKELLRRTIFFLAIILLSIMYWFYQAKKWEIFNCF